MSKISFSLRRIAKNWADKPDSAAIFTDAADEIESLAERIAELEARIKHLEREEPRSILLKDEYKRGMERAAEIAWQVHTEGDYVRTAYEASVAISKEIDND